MKNAIMFLVGFVCVAAVMILMAYPSFANDLEIANDDNGNIKVVGIFLNTYTGTKSALCLNDIVNCTIVYLPGNEVTGDTMQLYKLKEPIEKFLNGVKNPQFEKLYRSSQVIMD